MNRFFAVFVLFLVSASMLMGQLSSGSILGVVKDPSGAAIPDATVTVTNTSTNIARTATTDSDGSYRFDVMQPGPYTLTVTKDGFEKSTLTSLTLDVAQKLEANVALQVGSVQQEVSVNAELAPQVNVTTSSLGGLVNNQQIADLPLNGRNFIDLALLQPGVSSASNNGPNILKNATYFSTNGAPVRSNLTTLDGAPMMNLTGTTSSAIGTTLGVDGIQEFRVISNSFGAQYGITMGSQIVIASKGGTNTFHGDAFDYLRNNALDSWGYFAVAEPKLIRNNFGGSFGGPIKKDNTFFYAVYEGIRQIQGVTSSINTLTNACNPNANGGASSPLLGLAQGSNTCSTAPFTYQGTNYNCASGCATTSGAVNPAMKPFILFYPVGNAGTSAAPKYASNNNQPESDNYGQIRVDHTFSGADSIFGRFTIDKSSLAALSSFAGTSYQGVGVQTVGSDQFDTVAWNHIFSPTLLNTLRVSYSRTLNVNNPAFPASFAALPLIYNQPFGSITVSSLGSGALGAQGTAPQGFNENSYNMSDDINWTKGRHAIQFGTLLNRIEYYTFNAQSIRGAFTFSTTANFMGGDYTNFQSQVPGSDFYREPRFYTMGFYVQDDWRFNNRLTLNLGLRYEADTSPWDRHGANWAFRNLTDPAPTYGSILKNASFLNFEPRLGFAWDVRGNGKTAVRAAFGVYDDVNAGAEAFYGASAGSPPLSSMLNLPAGTVTALPFITSAFNSAPGTMPYGQAIKAIAYNDKQPRLFQWNVSVQQQITSSLSVTLAYVGTKGQNLWNYEEGNPCQPSSVTNGIPSWTSPFVIAPANILGAGTNPAGQLANPLFGQAGQSKYTSVVCNTVISPGTSSAHFLTATYPSNAAFPGTYIVPSSQNPLWGDWISAATNGLSNYHGGQLTINKRVSHGLEAQLAYTYSKVLDEAQGTHSSSECMASGGNPSVPQQPARHIFNYGPACFDVPQSLQASFIYRLPKTDVGGFLGRELLSGWWLGNKTAWQTGFPFSPTTNTWRTLDQNMNQQSADAASEYVNYGVTTVAPGQTGADGTVNTTTVTFIPYNKNTVIVNQKHAGFVQWFNPLMFTMNPIGQLGTVHKNVLRGPHFSDVDLSLNKDTAFPLFGEKGQMQFRLEVFNLFNHTNLALPAGFREFTGTLTDVGMYSEAPLATAGQTTSIVGNPRQIQLSLKVIF
jgi:hypothetical protein